MPHITLTESDQSPRVAPSTRMLHTYDINDLTLLAYDEDGSETTDRVASELIQDAYGFNGVPFESHDVVIDIGAHVGLVSLYLAKRWPSLRIHAFEPHPTNYRNAVDNLRLNDVSNVHLWHRAVTADRRSIVLRALSRNTGGATAVFDMPGTDSSPAVASVTLADICEIALAPGQRCRLLKIDCEGMEYELLPSPILDRVDFFAAEFHEHVAPGRPWDLEQGPAYALLRQCARFFRPERLRVVYCPKFD
jgi:FkbM family methyltransferase